MSRSTDGTSRSRSRSRSRSNQYLDLDMDQELQLPEDGDSEKMKTWTPDICDDVIDHDLLKLPDDVLYIILSFLDQSDLCKLSLVCSKFYHICSKDSVWLPHVRGTVLYDGPSLRPCTNKELYRITLNWEKRRFHSSFIAKTKVKLIPWLQKDDDEVWFSFGNVIRHFHRVQRRGWREDGKRSLTGMPKDATRFSAKHNMLVSGCRDGSVHLWTTTSDPFHVSYQVVHQSESLCVDLTDQAIVSGSKNGICTVTRIDHIYNQDTRSNLSDRSFNAEEKVWSLKVSPCERFFVAGLAGLLNSPPLIMWDIESGYCIGGLGSDHKRGAGILDIKFESQHQMLTCGYDAYLRLWDLRTQSCVAQWLEPFDYTLYSLASNGSNAISVGTSRHGLVRLWDKRSTKHVQCFYSNRCNSPVYSLAMDYANLFLALDMGFSTMNFSILKKKNI